ncbi:NAD-dependent epimerase/dehydratase family protein [Hoeflea sp. YIM 152468]|uniref:NAD-dependent epimerase/dehydratase family protein n=1 Tax=Hoeflea sp. YIM 152468 TaxID=3031759 RepID=UPI0023DB7DF2|nr:NAD-dependent epimerase/dehydratase family protein [Hoeflea sp. YIM 152468]MDF1610063.1 NAD-dependent epimerase/dehydratase family protein [Hoeflea sp. YIM 152468]
MTQPDYTTDHPVLVTGATGFVAGWLVKRLLEEGFVVHAAVRDPSNAAKTAHLTALAAELPGQLKLFGADLLTDGSYAEAMKGCRVVFHTASPFTSKFKDAQRDLVDPAVTGTRNVLETANGTESVERVVVTSSCAAIYGDTLDVAAAPGGVLTEDVWNTTSRLDHSPYAFSKVEAEKAAWDLARAQARWQLVTVNPSLVIGPTVSGASTSESHNLVKHFGDGILKAGAPPLEIGMVDVRDVAEAHMRAGFVTAAHGRYITSADTVSFLRLGQMLRGHFGDRWPFPTRELPKWLLWLVGPLIDKTLTREFVSRNMGHRWRADNAKARRELGIEFQPVSAAVIEMFQQLIDTGAVRPR